MGKWISCYLHKYHTDNTDATCKVSVLSASTMPATIKRNKSYAHIMGDLNYYNNTSCDSIFLTCLIQTPTTLTALVMQKDIVINSFNKIINIFLWRNLYG